MVIFDLDVRGGVVRARSGLAELIRKRLRGVRTVAYVNREATGAGAIVAMACDEIVMAPDSKFGNASPMSRGRTPLTDEERENMENPLRTEFRSAATARGYPAALAEGMVSAKIQVAQIRNVQTGDVFYARYSKYKDLVRPKVPESKWEFVHPAVVDVGEALTMTASEAREYGFTRRETVADLEALAKLYGVRLVRKVALLPTTRPVATRPGAPAIARRPAKPEAEPLIPGKTFSKAFIIPITEPIMPAMVDAVTRKIISVKSRGGDLVIFEFHTPGGRVDSAMKISKLIKRELADIPTIAFVNSEAISAGAWLALACDYMVLAPQSKIGDAAPILMQGKLEGVQREKMETYLRAEFRGSAKARGFPYALAEAMVSADIEVWLIENIHDGTTEIVARGDLEKPVIIPKSLSERVEGIASDPRAEWRLKEIVVGKGKLLTLTTSEAEEYGFMHRVVADLDELKTVAGITGEIYSLGDTWSERLVAFLGSLGVSSVLLLLAVFFGYIELNTPGFGVGGVLALICLAILFGSRYLTGMAHWWEIALFVIGVILLFGEIFVTPGFGVLGITGMVFCLVGLLASLIGNPPDSFPIPQGDLLTNYFLNGVFYLGLGFLGGCVVCIVAARFLPKTPVAGRLVLASPPVPSGAAPADEKAGIRHIRPGDAGVVEAPCRPVGKVRFGEELVDAMTEGDFLETGARVVVTRNEGNRLLVRPGQQA